jgi:hypothetical protein
VHFRASLSVLTLFAALLCNEALAQNPDISLSGSILPTGTQYQGTIATVTLVFTNVGTVSTTVNVARSNSLPFLSNEAVIPGNYGSSPCPLFFDSFLAPPGSGEQSTLRFGVDPGPIGVGESKTCTFGLRVRSTSLQPFTLRLEALSRGANGLMDVNAANGVVVFPLVFGGPQPIPAGGKSALALLAFLLVATTLLRTRFYRTAD